MPISIAFSQGSRGPVGVGFTLGIGDLSTFILEEIPTGAVDGVNQDYTTAHNFQKLWVYLNGLRMRVGVDYTLTDAHTFHFLYPPSTGDSLLVDYIT